MYTKLHAKHNTHSTPIKHARTKMPSTTSAPQASSATANAFDAPHLAGRARSSSLIDLNKEADVLTHRAYVFEDASIAKFRQKQYVGASVDGMKAVGAHMRSSLRNAVAACKLGFGDVSGGKRVFYEFGMPVALASSSNAGVAPQTNVQQQPAGTGIGTSAAIAPTSTSSTAPNVQSAI